MLAVRAPATPPASVLTFNVPESTAMLDPAAWACRPLIVTVPPPATVMRLALGFDSAPLIVKLATPRLMRVSLRTRSLGLMTLLNAPTSMRPAPRPALMVSSWLAGSLIVYPPVPANLSVPTVALRSSATVPPPPTKAASCSTPLGAKFPAQLAAVDQLLFVVALKVGSQRVMKLSPVKASVRQSASGVPPHPPALSRLPESGKCSLGRN